MSPPSPIAQPLGEGRWRVCLPGAAGAVEVDAGSGAEAVYRARIQLNPRRAPPSAPPDATVVDRLAGPELALFRGYGDVAKGLPWLSQGGGPVRRIRLWDGASTLIDARPIGAADPTDFGEDPPEPPGAGKPACAGTPPRPPEVVQVIPGREPPARRARPMPPWLGVRAACVLALVLAAGLPWVPAAAVLAFVAGTGWARAARVTPRDRLPAPSVLKPP
jgi:hypothetical protein